MDLTVDLGEQLNIANVHDRHLAWRDIVASEADLSVNGGELEKVDSAGLQLLLVLKRATEQASRKFRWASVSDELMQVAALVDLSRELELDHE